MLGKTEEKGEKGKRGWDGQIKITDSMEMNLSKLWKIAKERKTWCAAVQGVTKSWT